MRRLMMRSFRLNHINLRRKQSSGANLNFLVVNVVLADIRVFKLVSL